MDEKKPAKPKSDLKKPHHYGKRDGIDIFHALHESHDALIGKHIHNPSDQDLKNAISSAKDSGLAMVVIHGTPPESLRSKIHSTLGPVSPSQMNKSEGKVYFEDLFKTDDDEFVLHHGSNTLKPGKKPTPSKSAGSFLTTDYKFATNFAEEGGNVHSFRHPKHLIFDARNGSHVESLLSHPDNKESDLKHILGNSDLPHAYDGSPGSPEKLDKLREMTTRAGFVGSIQKETQWKGQPHSVELYSNKHLRPVKIKKSEENLNKAFTQPDQSTFTDIKAHAGTLAAAHPALMKWGAEKLSSLPKDAIESFELDGKTVKVRKHDADLYSGWIEHNGNKLHEFNKITLPELMTQLQSKLELYGKEDKAVAAKQDLSLDEHLDQLISLAREWFSENGQEFPEHALKTAETKKKLQDLKAKVESKQKASESELMTTDKLDELAQLHDDNKAVIPNKELVPGMLNPDPICEDCGSTAPFCDCYNFLPKPQIEVDYKNGRVSILFKKEWDDESKINFCEDLKRRAGVILRNKWKDKL